MSTVRVFEQRRLGLVSILRDHMATWSARSGEDGKRDRRRTAAWLYGAPTPVAAVFLFAHIHLQGLGQILAGGSAFTALLFALLGIMFNAAITLRKDGGSIGNAHGLRELIAAIRATTTYAIVVAAALLATVIVAAATTGPRDVTPWGFTPVVVWLFLHLALTLLGILRSFRTAFNYIAR